MSYVLNAYLLTYLLIILGVKYVVNLFICQGKSKRLDSASSWTHKALRYGTRSQGIAQFYLHTQRLSANGMNHTCLFLLAQAGPFYISYFINSVCF